MTGCEVGAERSFLKRLGGGCQLPIAAFAKKSGGKIVLEGLVGSVDGRVMIRHEVKGPAADVRGPRGGNSRSRSWREGGRALLDEVYREEK